MTVNRKRANVTRIQNLFCDGTHKAFFLPLGEKESDMKQTWDNANETCAKLNASLVEIHDWRKQFIFNSFWGHLGS